VLAQHQVMLNARTPLIVPFVLFMLMPLSLWAGRPHIVDPWPDPAHVEGIRVTRVSFLSSDPFVPRDFGHAPNRIVEAQLFLPENASPHNKVPAVVLLHGSAGNADERAATYGPPLSAMGIAVLVIETYASRPDFGTSFIERVIHITESMFVADAYAGLRYLAEQPEIDANHVVLAGFSYGGMASTYALYAQIADKLAPPGLRFAGHVAFYAPCIARFADSRTTGAPLLMLYGAKDQLIRPERCAQVADDLRRGGSEVDVISYPDAVHQWDGWRPLGVIGRQLAGCRFRVERDGTVRDERTWLPMNGPFLRKIILGLCTHPPPYPIGRSEQTVLLSNRDFGRFLARVFAQAG
jgi:dienelactone hydrolase